MAFFSVFSRSQRTSPTILDSKSSGSMYHSRVTVTRSCSMTGAIILRISHGYRVLPQDDPFNKLAEDAMDKFSKAASPRNFPANVLPFCALAISVLYTKPIDRPSVLKLPEWFPGAGFKRTGRAWRATFDEMAQLPFRLVKTQLVRPS